MEKRLKPVKISDKFFKEIKSSIHELVDIEFDKVMLDILAYVILNEPASLYRATRESPYSISLVYKKAKKMVNLGLIKKISSEAGSDRRSKHLYISTVKGLLVCFSFNCTDKKTFVSRLSAKWNLKTNKDLYSLLPVFKLLPYVITQNDVTVLENPSLLMLNIIDNKQYEGLNPISDSNIKEAQKAAMRCLVGEILNRIIKDDKEIKETNICVDEGTLIGTRNGVVRFDPDKKSIFVYSCEMCKKGCCMVSIPINDSSCKLLLDLKSKIELIPTLFFK
jgi:predicted transcriptional regulator